MARQGFISNNAGSPGEADPYVYQETNGGTSSSMGLDSGDSTFKISVSSVPNVGPNSTTQITIDPAGNITLNPNIKLVINSPTEMVGGLKMDTLNHTGVMQTDASGNVSSSNGTNGQLLIGGGAAPVWANLTSSGGSVTITNGANSINLESSGGGALTSLAGNSGSATPLAGVINVVGGTLISTTGASHTLTVNVTGGTNGQVIVGATAGSPAFATLTSSGGTITYTLGANTLNIDGTPATTSQVGVVELATNAETIAGSNTVKATTPDDIKAKLGTQTIHAVLVGAGQTAAVTAITPGTTNTVLLGNTGADPSFGQVPTAALVSSTITLNNGNNITVTGSPITLGGAATIAVTGTTNHAVQIGNASASLTSLTVGTNGQVLLGSTGADPAFATLTSTGGTITFTTGAGTLNLDGTAATTTQAGVVELATNAETIAGAVTTKAVTPDDLKAKLGTQTNHGVLVGASQTAAVTALAVGSTNTVLLGNTGADPSFGTVPNAALTNSSVTISAGNNISVSGGSPLALGGTATVNVAGTTNHAVQVGNASAALTSLTVGLNGQILIGASAANPAFANLTSSDSSITITTGANTLDIKTTAAAGVSSVTGTANQVTSSPTTGAVVLSTPSVFIAPGSIEATTSMTADTIFNTPTTSSTVGQYQINGTRVLHTYGTRNTFLGSGAGNFTLTIGSATGNVALGASSTLSALTTGANNVAIGDGSTPLATTGNGNVAIGAGTLAGITTGLHNTAVGGFALQNATTSATRNLVLGFSSGSAYTGNESDNILLNSPGVAAENNILRIGGGTGTGPFSVNKAFISGISGVTVTGTAVLISGSDQLGIAVSSSRFKENIADMRDASSGILSLRPVTFNYTVGEDDSQQTGLIAEEVATLMPNLVVYDKQGLPQTVKYHELPALLLNELQKALKRIDALEEALHGK